jgi:hypothetical protein
MRILRVFALAAVMFLSSFGIATANSFVYCSIPAGQGSFWCRNEMYVGDNVSNFTHVLQDLVSAPDAYHIYFTMTSWYPTVRGGNPVYQTYWIMDNLNSQMIFQDSSYWGRPLFNYSSINIGTGVTAGYYPQPYGSPTSVLTIKNMPDSQCAAQWWDCHEYDQGQQYSIP